MTEHRLQDDARLAISFLTRLPMTLRIAPPAGALASAMRAFPLVGAAIGLAVGGLFALCHWLLPPLPAALIALAGGIVLTGGLHEDGFADCADGFGGGKDRDAKLAIMRDSRIGTYGGLALILSLTLRAGALASFTNMRWAIMTMVAAHSLARAGLPLAMTLLPAASDSGLAVQAGKPTGREAGPAVMLAVLITMLVLPHGAALAAILAAGCALAAVGWLAKRQIGGYSGDVLGAMEQTIEIAVLLAVLAVLKPAS